MNELIHEHDKSAAEVELIVRSLIGRALGEPKIDGVGLVKRAGVVVQEPECRAESAQ